MDIDDNAFKGIEAIIHSMTPAERDDPKILEWKSQKTDCYGKRNRYPGSQPADQAI